MSERQQDANEKHNARIAAFFDLDGTLTPLPSLERRFLRILRYRREVSLKNYWLWLREAVRLLPRGISAVTHANKMYLKGVHGLDESGTENRSDSPGHKSGHLGEGQASAPPRRNPRWPVPRFFVEAVERLTCHAMLGQAIVLVTGTLAPLAAEAARKLEAELAACRFPTTIRVCATKLEQTGGRWTGKILGEAVFGEAKARAVRTLAEEMQLDLAQCWAYGDNGQDRWMLAAVGNPVTVNPSPKLLRIARKRGWPVLHWDQEQLARRTKRKEGNGIDSLQVAPARGRKEGKTCINSSAAISGSGSAV